MNPVTRPPADAKKIRTSDSFELCYLRHQYFRRAKYNPTEAEMAPFMKIVEHFTKNTFFTYPNLFKTVGMYHEDVLNIGRVHLVSFLGLYALEQMEEKKKDFADKFSRYNYRDPEEKDFDQKNKANFTMFFKQRMEDLVRVCRQKVRNIKGQSSEEYLVFCGTTYPKYPRRLLKNYEDLGYKKVDFAVFKSIRKKAGVEHDATAFEFNGIWYVAIALEQKGLELEDIVNSETNPYNSRHNMQPDELFANLPIKGPQWSRCDESGENVVTKDESETEQFSKLFGRRSNHRKKAALRNFIAKNKNNRQYKEEILTAKKILRSIGE